MKKTVYKQFNTLPMYKEFNEQRLEELALEGLFLVKMGRNFWKFEKREAKKVKYAISYFFKSSVYDPEVLEEQKDFFEIAEESGWSLVSFFDKVHVFMSTEENPVPFETDEKEFLDNAKTSMSMITLSQIIMIIIFSINLLMRVSVLFDSPLRFFRDSGSVMIIAMYIPIIIIWLCEFLSIKSWFKKSQKSIDTGGTCIMKKYNTKYPIALILIAYMFFVVVVYLFAITENIIFPTVLFLISYTLILFLAIPVLSNIFKKMKLMASWNIFLCVVIALVLTMGLIFGIGYYIMGNPAFDDTEVNVEEFPLVITDFHPDEAENTWESFEYTYESIFLKEANYYEIINSSKLGELHLDYTIITLKFDFLLDIIVGDILDGEDYRPSEGIEIDAQPFGADKAYILRDIDDFEQGNQKGWYLLIYGNEILEIYFDDEMTENEISVLKEKFAH